MTPTSLFSSFPRRMLDRSFSGSVGRCIVAVLIAVLPMTESAAASVDWTRGNFDYATTGANVVDVLNAFASAQNQPVSVDGPLNGVVAGRFSMAPVRFLDTLGSEFGFVWWYDGAVLRISPAAAQISLALRPQVLTPNALVAALTGAGLTDAHFPLSIDADTHAVNVTGPVAYVNRIHATSDRLERDAGSSTLTAVRIFRLTHASAADDVRIVDGRRFVIPGAGTLLRHRFRPHQTDAAGGAVPELIELGRPLPVIEADARTNSLLVRDVPWRIAADEALVKDIDVLPNVVSIQAWVVDVDADELRALKDGLPATFARHFGDDGDRVKASVCIVPDGGRMLIDRLRGFAIAHRAAMNVSRTLLTQDRSPAVLDRHEEQLAGEPEDPSRDLWLSVRPTVHGNTAGAMIELSVDIGHSDGSDDHRRVHGSVALGEGLLVTTPRDAPDRPGASLRLMLLVPRIAA
ncbi:type II/III secretion system family protein [Burkholderia sp. Ac-20384]|uniref:secretin N-terminal domain-containing protein n=1 Tax=Burkholderia sp. Ac-20384 TaxID=2703902 RepID=UPI0019809F01|nr:secretin N-terminal domain-containing protein [Burkholderia sp. Ac-20384]MBN3825115.1 type II/III secretion system family protein [Burkholderia sp. Ac-20384]